MINVFYLFQMTGFHDRYAPVCMAAATPDLRTFSNKSLKFRIADPGTAVRPGSLDPIKTYYI